MTRWMAANVAVAPAPAGNLKPATDRSTVRIDGIVAIIMALGRAMLPQEPAPPYVPILGQAPEGLVLVRGAASSRTAGLASQARCTEISASM